MGETLPAATDSDLLHRYTRRQDQAAFAELVNRHQSMVTGVAVRRTGDPELARDVAQQVFVLLARKAGQLLRHDRLGGWLYRTASFEAAKLQQSENRRRSRQSDFAALPGSDHHACQEHWQILEDAMAALPDSDRDVIIQHYFQDASYTDMAARAAVSEAAIRKRVSRALQHLSRHLQRRGHAVPAVALLTTAVAMQATVPAQASLAASALTLAGSAPAAGWLSWTAIMTTNTALKTTAAVAILAAIPIAWQARENAVLRAHLAAQQPVTPPPVQTAQQHTDTSKQSAALASSRPITTAAAQARLQALQEERSRVQSRLASLQSQAAQLKSEVVVSLGRVDEVAQKMADLQLTILELERLEGDPAAREKLAQKVMALTTEMMPVMAEYRTIGADPKLSARLTATTTAKVAGVSDSVRAEIESRLLRHYQAMKRDGLTLDRRPAQNRQDWDRRYGEASVAAMRDIEHLLPASYRQSAIWQSQTSSDAASNLNFLEAAFGDPALAPATPTTKAAP